MVSAFWLLVMKAWLNLEKATVSSKMFSLLPLDGSTLIKIYRYNIYRSRGLLATGDPPLCLQTCIMTLSDMAPMMTGDILSYIMVHCTPITSLSYYFIFIKNIDSYNKTVHDFLMKEIPLILPNLQKNNKEKRGIITLLVTGFIRLAYKGIYIYLDNKRQTALKKAFIAMENQVNLERH